MKLLQTLFGLILLLGSALGLFLSSWIVLTTPYFFTYRLSVGAPEVSPWLMGLNAIVGLLALGLRVSWLKWTVLILSGVGFALSASPLVQFPTTIQRINTAIAATWGTDYQNRVPVSLQKQWRPHPLVLTDVFQGISLESVRVATDIPFANPDNIPLTLNVYRPMQPGTYPGVVMIHGGAWRSGSPYDNEQFNRYLAAQGYTVIAISYRLAPTHLFPAQLDDVQTALRFIQQHAAEYEMDENRMALMGRSAGAHLAMLAAYQPDAPAFRAVVNYYGPVNLEAGYYDLPNPDPINVRLMLEGFIGGAPSSFAKQYQQASPSNLVRSGLPPTLLIYGDRDHIVQSKFGRRLAEQLRSFNNSAVFINIPWAEHAFDAVFNGISNQLAIYYTERFLGWALHSE
ncbi:MAG: alpha/beta hydrolase [Leptolyngbyaceae cyanobacterium bins.302]|nr:alpha/beta hydrolase [Leptolyngbyaceae cyanobacterium bins.302]